METNVNTLHKSLAEFKAAASRLARELEQNDIHELACYPPYLPSFDEFVVDVQDVEFFDVDVDFQVSR